MQPSFNDTYNTWKWKWSRSVVSDSLLPNGHQAPPSMGFSRQESWSGLQYLNIHIIKVSMDRWIKTMQYIYGREYYWARKQDAVMTFAATEMDSEMILRSDAIHSEKDKHPIMWLMRCAVLSCFSRVPLFATPWTVVHQAPLSMGLSRQEYWSGLPFPPPGDLPDSGTELMSLTSSALAGGFFTTGAISEAWLWLIGGN